MNYDFYLKPPAYGALTQKLRELKRDFPFLQISSIGQSLTGRNIYAASVGTGNPCVLFAGTFGAQEWLSCSLLVRFLENVCLSYCQRTTIAGAFLNNSLLSRGLTVVPMVNPDGVSITLEGGRTAVQGAGSASRASWQTNARGIDLSRNFDAAFSASPQEGKERSMGEEGYGGAFPHSEPESRALVRFLHSRRVESVYAFRTSGEVIYGEHGPYTPAQSRYTGKLLSEASGYALSGEAEPAGSFKDYFMEKFHRPGFTLRAGTGESPLPMSELEGIYGKLLEAMVIGATI